MAKRKPIIILLCLLFLIFIIFIQKDKESDKQLPDKQISDNQTKVPAKALENISNPKKTEKDLIKEREELVKQYLTVYAVHEDKIEELKRWNIPSEIIKAIEKLMWNAKSHESRITFKGHNILLKKEYSHVIISTIFSFCFDEQKKNCKFYPDSMQQPITSLAATYQKGMIFTKEKNGKINWKTPQVTICRSSDIFCKNYSLFRFFPGGDREIEIDDLTRMAGSKGVLTRDAIMQLWRKVEAEINDIANRSGQNEGRIVPRVNFKILSTKK